MKNFVVTKRITQRDNELISTYFRDVVKYRLFTPEEEYNCTLKSSKGDKKAIDELVKRNLRFVITVAKEYQINDISLADLINEGNIGLIEAAKRYNPDKGFKFISYAIWWIRKYIFEYLTNVSRKVRIPTNRINSLNVLNNKITLLEQTSFRNIDIQEILSEFDSEMETDEDEKKITREINNLTAINNISFDSLDKEVKFDDSPSGTILDFIDDRESYDDSDYLLNISDNTRQVSRLIETLKPKEQYVLVSIFGLDGGRPKTLDEVASLAGMTREGIRLIKEKSLKKLKKSCIESNLTFTF